MRWLLWTSLEHLLPMVDPDGYLLAAVAGRGMFRARLP